MNPADAATGPLDALRTNDVKILLHEEQVRAGVRRMAEEINAH